MTRDEKGAIGMLIVVSIGSIWLASTIYIVSHFIIKYR